jgi:hypothetical protein
VSERRTSTGTPNAAKSRLSRILAVGRWVSLGIFALIVGIQYFVPEATIFGRSLIGGQRVVELRSGERDAQAIADAIEKAPDASLYRHATSIKLVEMGHQLLDEPKYRAYVAKQLHALSTDPALFGDDITSYLALRMAYWQLRHDPNLSGSAEAAVLMWEAAEQIDRVGRYRSAQNAPAQ